MEDGKGSVELLAMVDKILRVAGEKLESLLHATSLSPDEIIKRDNLLGSRLLLLARHHAVVNLNNAMG